MVTQNYEEMVNLYHSINVYCAIGAAVFLVAAIVLFILLKIPQVFGELTGRTAQRVINQMTSGDVSGNMASSKIGTDGRQKKKGHTGVLGTGRLRKNTSSLSRKMQDTLPVEPAMERIQPPVANPIADTGNDNWDAYGSAETDVLDNFGSAETDVLNKFEDAETDILTTPVYEEKPQETCYQAPESETMVLSQDLRPKQNSFVILRSIVEIHTDEVI